ncbi:MAG: hypothetical protein C0508_21305 [Cyanobacteria bacterium PR.023]|nr:hypothetical protein [Cyanobacteria bacterium PR.023]
MKQIISFACCLGSLLLLPPFAAAAPIPSRSQLDFRIQISSHTPVVVVEGSDSARLRDDLYAVNPFDTSESDYRYYLKLADDFVRLRAILDNEVASRKSVSAVGANRQDLGIALDRQLSSLSEKIDSERMAAMLSKVELTKRQVVFSAKQLKDDLAAVPVYVSSGHSSGASSSSGVRTLKRAFSSKFGMLVDQLKKDCLALDALYQQRRDSIATTGDSLKKQMNSTVGSSKVSDRGTTMYVRNYVNFGGSDQSQNQANSGYIVPAARPPVSLLAVPGKLSQPASLNRSRPRP